MEDAVCAHKDDDGDHRDAILVKTLYYDGSGEEQPLEDVVRVHVEDTCDPLKAVLVMISRKVDGERWVEGSV